MPCPSTASFTLNLHGRLLSLAVPQVMGIVNCTPDSFYADSRTTTEAAIVRRALLMVAEGAAILDVGACSTRPDSRPVDEHEEMERLRRALPLLQQACPTLPLSVDTYRPDVARMCVEEYGVAMVNDVGQPASHRERTDKEREAMWRMVAHLRVPYVLTSSADSLDTMLVNMAQHVAELHALGVADVVADPGFGFGKTLEQNYDVLHRLDELHLLRVPLLVGLSRKSMFTRLLGIDAADALNATTVAHTIALTKGVHLLRTHDVKAAVEAVKIVNAYTQQSKAANSNSSK